MSDIADAYWRAPPIARNFATAVLVTSIGCHFGLLPFSWFYFEPSQLLRIPPGIWRPMTSFFLSQPQLGIILDPYFLYQYLSQLEVGNPRFPRKEDVLWYLICVGTFIMVLCHFFTGHIFFLPALILALAYTTHQDMRGQQATFFFFTVPAQLVPYCMLVVSLLMSPGLLPLQIAGLVAAHLYDFLARIYPEFGGGPNLLKTPAFLSRLVTTPRIVQRAYGTAIRPSSGQGRPLGSATGSSAGGSVLPESWRSRGTGHRLGGD
ncbi:hypothetical protein VTK73DRAFT_9039 [Phialemonium thermophilum]|uniref:Derlin n=1 Tax=Phialemonium thermophilum TaxID=223376 RepID=A0ABR3XLM1_9PEZI